MNNIKKSIIQLQKKVETHTVSFDTNGGTSLDPIVVARNTIPEYRKNNLSTTTIDDSILYNWYTSETNPFIFDTIINSDTTLQAN
jgi:hypothetical protein